MSKANVLFKAIRDQHQGRTQKFFEGGGEKRTFQNIAGQLKKVTDAFYGLNQASKPDGSFHVKSL